jgi:hypothetical protein
MYLIEKIDTKIQNKFIYNLGENFCILKIEI